MAYTTWQDLLDDEPEEAPEEAPPAEPGAAPPAGAPPGDEAPADPGVEPTEAGPTLAEPERERILRSVPGLAELVARRKQLERKMRAVAGGGAGDEDRSERERRQFPLVHATPESRILDRRLSRLDADRHLAAQHELAERRAEAEDTQVREDRRRRGLADKATQRRQLWLERTRKAEQVREALNQEQIALRWQGQKVMAARDRFQALREQRGRLDALDLARLGRSSDDRRAAAAEGLREGLRRGWAELAPGLAPKRRADELEFERRQSRPRGLGPLSLDGLGPADLRRDGLRPERLERLARRALDRPMREAERRARDKLEPKLRPLDDAWGELERKFNEGMRPPPMRPTPGEDAESREAREEADAEQREALAEAQREMKQDMREEMGFDPLDREETKRALAQKAAEKRREALRETRRLAERELERRFSKKKKY